MTIIEELVLYEVTFGMAAYAVLVTRIQWSRRPKIGWDPEQLRWRAARAIYAERRWH